MKFLVVAFVAASLSSVLARPGGYTLNGGVYKFDPSRNLDFMEHAMKAGKFAWSKKFEEEVESEQKERGERNTQYVPSFFTAPQHHAAIIAAARPHQQQQQQRTFVASPGPQVARDQRETPVAGLGSEQHLYTAPLYYQQY